MKEEALKLAFELEVDLGSNNYSDMIRKLVAKVEELQVTKFHLEGDVNRLEDQVNELLVAKHFAPQTKPNTSLWESLDKVYENCKCPSCVTPQTKPDYKIVGKANTIEELFKQLESEIPFAMAILNENGDVTEYGPYQIDFAHEIPHIPLYTAPQTKPLSDEEIEQILTKVAMDNENVYSYDSCDVFESMEFSRVGIFALTRAIEEAHGIL